MFSISIVYYYTVLINELPSSQITTTAFLLTSNIIALPFASALFYAGHRRDFGRIVWKATYIAILFTARALLMLWER
jgi:hypothetical protein